MMLTINLAKSFPSDLPRSTTKNYNVNCRDLLLSLNGRRFQTIRRTISINAVSFHDSVGQQFFTIRNTYNSNHYW